MCVLLIYRMSECNLCVSGIATKVNGRLKCPLRLSMHTGILMNAAAIHFLAAKNKTETWNLNSSFAVTTRGWGHLI